ncbi:MAG: cytochrome bc1 complex diheme cytochrome c subunit [Acidimicrobiales bacterium]
MRTRLLVPIALVAFVASLGLSFFVSTPARAQVLASGSSPTTVQPGAKATTETTYPPVRGTASTTPSPALTAPSLPASTPTTVSLASANQANGHILFQTNCASCHGADARGSARAPNLVGLGAATVDFWLSTGRMPLSYPTAQAVAKAPRFSSTEIRDIVKYVTSLGAGGQGIPNVDLKSANMGNGFALFTTNCAGCHGVTGVGDALTNGLHAPSLYRAASSNKGLTVPISKTVVAEAMRTGPGNMPRFGPNQLSQQEVTDVVDYVINGGIEKPYDKGGHGLGHVGPITEGFVALFGGLGFILLISFWIGDRAGGKAEA